MLSRPEQPIVLAALAALLVAFADGAAARLPDTAARSAWMRSLAIVALTAIAFSYHVKGLFVLPLMLGCLWFASRGPKAHLPRLVAGLSILAATASATLYWKHRLDCPGNAVLAKTYDVHNLGSAIARIASLEDAWALAGRLIGNVDIFIYVANIGPQVHPLASWLAEDQIAQDASFHWFLALCVAWGLALLVAVATLAIALSADWRARRLDRRTALALVILGVVIAWSATQLIRNFYDSKLVLPLLALAIVLALARGGSDRLRPLVNVTASAVTLFALVSPFAIGAIYAPSFARAAGQEGRLIEQSQSVSVFGYAALKPDILAAARLCGIGDPARSHAVMIDDTTYFAFMRSQLPQHEMGVVRGWSGHLADPIGYLRGRGSDGAVVECRSLPPEQRGRARSVGRFCCLGPPNW